MDFDPARYDEPLSAILDAIDAIGPIERGGAQGEVAAALDPRTLDRILRKHPRDGKGFFSRSQILAGFRRLRAPAGSPEEAAFARRLRLRPVRTQSGVAPITVLTRPFPCPGRCVFCPNDVRMPKSYLSDEPGAQRAAAHGFDPYRQTWSRLAALRAIGHPTDKAELIVLGGTWSAYPEAYRRGFVRACLQAMNDFGSRAPHGDRDAGSPAAGRTRRVVGQGPSVDYNRVVRERLRREAAAGAAGLEPASWAELERAQRANETAGTRCVGLSLETRPDCVDAAEVACLRRLGATKVQVGIQSLCDDVLARNRRGHDVAAIRRALALLRAAGFKLHVHWMPNLLGSTPEADLRDARRLFEDPDVRPDELKIYPCSLVESADLVAHWRAGEWRPYTHDELLEVVTRALGGVPRWCRVTRVVRDISSDDIVVGNKLTNFREIAERRLAENGTPPVDIRAREIRGDGFEPGRVVSRCTAYETGIGRELFLERTTPDDRLLGYLRLSLPKRPAELPELGDAAVVRELHVYGAALPLGAGARRVQDAQHRGFGGDLLREAARRARAAGFTRLAVVSAVGTRAYYRRHGFEDGPLYQHRPLLFRKGTELCSERGRS